MTRTPIPARRPPSAKSSHHIPRTIATSRRTRDSPRRSSNLFRMRRDSIDFSDDGVDRDDRYTAHDENDPGHAFAPANKPRISYSWDDETTLVSALLHDGPGADPADPCAKLTALADSLQEPFTDAGIALRKDMAHTLQPAVQSVTVAHRNLTRRVDPMFATGLLAFDDACKGLESLAIDEHRALQHTFAATETRIKDLFARLEDAYRHRDQLWTDLEAVLATTVDPALAVLAEVPAATERTIAALEKHAKTLAAKDDDGADKIRGVLAKFA